MSNVPIEHQVNKSDHPFKQFPMDGNPWRIDWLGRVFYSIDNEPLIRVHLSRLIRNAPANEALNKSSLHLDHKNHAIQICIDLKIGFIQLLKLGSVWINGHRQYQYRATEKTFEWENPSNFEITHLSRGGNTKSLNDWENTLTNAQHLISDDARHGAFVVLDYRNPSYEKIIIPSSVIFQSCYVTSPKAATRILFGNLNKIVDIEKSGYIDNNKDIFKLLLFQDFKDDEAAMLSNLLFNKRAFKNLKSLRSQIVRASIEGKTEGVNINVGFPFTVATKFKVLGKPVPYFNKEQPKKETWGFFVTEIISIQTQFPFKTLLIDRKNNNKKGESLAENPTPISYQPNKQELDDEEDSLDSLTNDDVSALLKPNDIKNTSILDTNNIKILAEGKDYQQYINMPFTAFNDEKPIPSNKSSTGPQRHIKDGAAETNIGLSPVKLEEIFKVLNHLRSENLNVETLAVNIPTQHESGEIVNYLPRKIEGHRTIHLTEDGSRTRAFVIAQVYTSGNYYYLIDIEPKRTAAVSIGLFSNAHKTQIDPNRFKNLMVSIVKENGWSFLKNDSSKDKSWLFKPIDHSRKGNSKVVAINILKFINISYH